MRTGKRLLPGQPVTRKLLRKYGEDLVCVCYREDAKTKIKLKTVEIILERVPWPTDSDRFVAGVPMIDKIVGVKIRYKLQRKARAAGGKWNRAKQVWELPYGKVLNFGWADRIVALENGH